MSKGIPFYVENYVHTPELQYNCEMKIAKMEVPMNDGFMNGYTEGYQDFPVCNHIHV